MQYTFGPLMVLYLLTALKGTVSNPSTREAVAGSTGRLEKQPILLHDRQRSADLEKRLYCEYPKPGC